MRREVEYLYDILNANAAIQRYIHGKDQDAFHADDLLTSAVLSKLMIIGEAVANVSEATREKYPKVPWIQITGFRNFIVHVYFNINPSILWNAATLNAPELAQAIEHILQNEYPHIDPERL